MTITDLDAAAPSTDWRNQAACAGHPDPDLWFPISSDDPATEAKRICAGCPVREVCGMIAVRTNEQYAVAGGYRTSNPDERAELQAWLGFGRSPAYRVRCTECDTVFTTRTKFNTCEDCRGLMPVADVRRHINDLMDAGRSARSIAASAGVGFSTICKLADSEDGWQHVHKTLARRILAITLDDADDAEAVA
ncbi:WhiB family transcriptional regulator [Nocardia amamiensis]|uniref:WhiB family transcriptional regulator n=1 Tax=Nocardia amamiensis TaxID=404578 RepID=A0ABS0D0E6_9NOCA|nr:WhiB family transcriptional regulator [Nocardia amamiensis]MBF6302286.1 WhiB family transcriptional regulator [Nocardia amamiensis]